MPNSANGTVNRIVGRGLISHATIADELRERLADALTEEFDIFGRHDLLALARRILAEFEPALAQNIFDTELAAWVAGAHGVASRLPPWAMREFVAINNAAGGGRKTPGGNVTTAMPDGPDDKPIVRFPVIDEARRNLLRRGVVTRDVFDALASDAKAQAFTVAGINSEKTLEKIRDDLAALVEQGPTLREFKRGLRESLDTSHIGDAHAETIYRTNVQAAYSAGRDVLTSNPIVASVFPYREYIPIHDGRVDPEHLALGSLGLNGTGIYRADDPMWDYFSPPWRYNCRCGTNEKTIEAAARGGVEEAKLWLRTGQPPADPEWRLDHIPFRPDPRWSTRRTVGAA